jgi:hypothetical protein
MFSFVDDGYEQACKAIRAEVESKYAEQLEAATADDRKVLLSRIEAEVQVMIKRKAPSGGLY